LSTEEGTNVKIARVGKRKSRAPEQRGSEPFLPRPPFPSLFPSFLHPRFLVSHLIERRPTVSRADLAIHGLDVHHALARLLAAGHPGVGWPPSWTLAGRRNRGTRTTHARTHSRGGWAARVLHRLSLSCPLGSPSGPSSQRAMCRSSLVGE